LGESRDGHFPVFLGPGYGIVTELVECHNQAGELVMVCEHLLLVQKMTA
jgi:acyl dehydratase